MPRSSVAARVSICTCVVTAIVGFVGVVAYVQEFQEEKTACLAFVNSQQYTTESKSCAYKVLQNKSLGFLPDPYCVGLICGMESIKGQESCDLISADVCSEMLSTAKGARCKAYVKGCDADFHITSPSVQLRSKSLASPPIAADSSGPGCPWPKAPPNASQVTCTLSNQTAPNIVEGAVCVPACVAPLRSTVSSMQCRGGVLTPSTWECQENPGLLSGNPLSLRPAHDSNGGWAAVFFRSEARFGARGFVASASRSRCARRNYGWHSGGSCAWS